MPSARSPGGPIAKRQKLVVADKVVPPPRRSRIFAPYRTIGLISPTDVPFSVDPRGKTTFNITTSVGRSLQTYDLRRGLHLIFVTRPQTPEDITAITSWNDHILTAWGSTNGKGDNGVWVFKRGKKTGELQKPAGKSENITQLLPLGSWLVGCGKKTIQVWSSTSFEHYTTIHVGQGRRGVTVTGGICNMPTYLNKILVGTSDGCVELWNISTGKLRYTVFPGQSNMGAVTTIEPTPALSLFAIAYASGDVVIQNARTDRPVISFNAGSKAAPVTTISFRSDGLGAGEDGQKPGVMATATKAHGDVTFWDLNNGGRKMGVLRGAHSPPATTNRGIRGGISKVEFLPGQGVILTSGLDNALKSWIFDEQPFSSIPRILHSRSGHAAPISNLQFLPVNADGSENDGKWLLSASRDRSLWGWSLRRDAQSTELSQGNVRKKAKNMGILNNSLAGPDGSMSLEDLKAPKITCMACSLNRDGGIGTMPGTRESWVAPSNIKSTSTAESSTTGWESVVTGHEGDKFARTWFWGRKRAGRWKFETTDGSNVTSVAITLCGTFALVGSEAGGIDMFNLQSGIRRQRFPAPITKKQAEQQRVQAVQNELEGGDITEKKFLRGQGKHTRAITGIQVDSLNQMVISSGADGKVKFWDFGKGILLHELDWSLTSVGSMRYHRPTDLIALSCDDSSIRIIDIGTKKLVRELWGCSGKIQDFTFSNDGRWVIAISADSILRIWDLPTGHLIEALRFKSKPTAIAFSTTGEYLATAHEDTVGVHIWTNRTLFTHVSTRHITNTEIIDIDAPMIDGENNETALEAAFDDDEQAEDESTAAPTIDQLSADLLTLSLVPKSRWQTLLHLDAIRERNKPKEAPKAPERAPFFLPSLEGEKTGPAASNALIPSQGNQESASRISKLSTLQHQQTSAFAALIYSSSSQALAHLATLPPSAADLAIRTLDPSPPYTELSTFVNLLTERLREKRDYELVQAWMSVFLKCHGEVVLESEELRGALRQWEAVSKGEVSRLGELVGFCKGVGGWVGGIV